VTAHGEEVTAERAFRECFDELVAGK